jgi:hypothetical protein
LPPTPTWTWVEFTHYWERVYDFSVGNLPLKSFRVSDRARIRSIYTNKLYIVSLRNGKVFTSSVAFHGWRLRFFLVLCNISLTGCASSFIHSHTAGQPDCFEFG